MLQQSKNQIVNKTIKRLLSSAVLMTLPFTMAAAKDNQELIDLARQEAQQGTFEIMVSSPKGERAQRKLMEEFQKRFDLDLDWDWSPLTSTVRSEERRVGKECRPRGARERLKDKTGIGRMQPSSRESHHAGDAW